MRRVRVRIPAPARFWSHVDQVPDGCWLWTARRMKHGYGTFMESSNDEARAVLAHRYAYEQVVGPIPAGLELDHLCRNRACVNPAHLEPVTHAENMRRAAAARRAA